MYKEEWLQWEVDAFAVLTATKYTPQEAEVIVDWFGRIKGSDERDLVGDAFVDAFVDTCPRKYFSVYDSMMSRLFVYAPFILEQYQLENSM